MVTGQAASFVPGANQVHLSNVPYRTGTYHLEDIHVHYGGVGDAVS